MIYWTGVRSKLLKHCPEQANEWGLKDIIFYLNKCERLSMEKIALLTEGECGRTSLCLRIKQLNKEK